MSHTDAVCVAIALGLCLTREKNRRWIKEWYNRSPRYATEILTWEKQSAFIHYTKLFGHWK